VVNSRRLPCRCGDTDHCPVGLFCPCSVRVHTPSLSRMPFSLFSRHANTSMTDTASPLQLLDNTDHLTPLATTEEAFHGRNQLLSARVYKRRFCKSFFLILLSLLHIKQSTSLCK
jgi:hypothetical protein